MALGKDYTFTRSSLDGRNRQPSNMHLSKVRNNSKYLLKRLVPKTLEVCKMPFLIDSLLFHFISFLCNCLISSPAVLSVCYPSKKCFSHPSLVLYSFATSPITLKLRQQIRGGLLIANHLDI
jgi:hypothetical protein